MRTIKEKYDKEVAPKMRKQFGYKNSLAVPRIVKVVIAVGTGSLKEEGKRDMIEKSLALITGQKPAKNPAKKSIASFKLRQGMTIGYSVTMRGKRMYDFLERLINVAIPRIRDFRGLSANSIDEMGNLTIGIEEHIVFPEVGDQDVRDVFGLGVTLATNAKTKKEALELFRLLGFAFKK